MLDVDRRKRRRLIQEALDELGGPPVSPADEALRAFAVREARVIREVLAALG